MSREGERVVNPDTGQILARRGNGWVDVTPTEAQQMAAEFHPVGAFGKSAEITALNFLDSGQEIAAQTVGRLKFGGDFADRQSALIRQRSTERTALAEALQETNPVASFLGAAAATAPLMFIPGGSQTKLIQLAAREAGIGAAEGFLSRPGNIGQRVQDAMLGGALSAAGASSFSMASRGVNSARTFTRNADAGKVTGQADIELSSRNIELEMETGVPRLGEAMQREYNKVASNATVGESIDPWKRELIRSADDLGLALTSGARTGNDQLRRMEAGLASNPLTSKPWDEMRAFNQKRLNDLARDAIGLEHGGAIGGAELGSAADEIGRQFEAVADRLGEFEVPATFIQQIEAAGQKHLRGFARSKSTQKYVDNIMDIVAENKNTLTGKQLVDGRSSLTRELQKASLAGDGNTMQGIYEVIGAIDDLMLQQSDAVTSALYTRARGGWRILDALEQGKALTTGGDVNAATLDTILRRRYPTEYRRSGMAGASGIPGGTLMDATKILTTFRDIVGDSGTATRMATQNFLDAPLTTTARGVVGATVGRAAFKASQSGTGSRLFQGNLLVDPSRSAARLGTVAGVAAANEQQDN